MAAVSTHETALPPLVAKCSDIGVLATVVACSIDDLLDSHPEEPALVDLVKRLREFTGTLDELQHQLDSPYLLIPARLGQSIKTSLENFHESLVHLEQRVVNVQLSVTGSDKQAPIDLSQIWPQGDIRTEGRILGFQFQNATLLISSIQENDVGERNRDSTSAVGIPIHSRNISNASSCTTVADPSRDSLIQPAPIIESQSTLTNPPEGISSTAGSGANQSPGLVRQTFSRAVLDTTTAGPAAAAPGPQSQGAQPSQKAPNVSRRKIARSFTWKLSAGGRQLVQQLCQACEENDHEWVKVLLNKGAYVNGHQTNGQVNLKTPLILALEGDAEPIVTTLLKNGADPSAKGTGQRTPVCIEMDRLLRSGSRSLRFLDLLLDYGANVEERIDGWSLLAVAVQHSRIDLVNFLLKRGANARPHHIFRQNMMLAGEVTMGVTMEIAASLLRAGATPNPDEAHEFYPLQYAITELKSLPWVKLLVSHGAVPSIVCKGKVPLSRSSQKFMLNPSLVHLAAQRGESSILEFLLSLGVNPNTTCRLNNGAGEVWNQLVPLHLAQTRNDVRLLVRHGANLAAQDSSGHTPLFWASANLDCDAIEACPELGSQPNARSFTGSTALHQLVVKLYKLDTAKADKAVMEKFYHAAKILLDAGARVDLRGLNKPSVYHTVTTEVPKFLADSSIPEDEERKAIRQIFEEIRALVIASKKGKLPADPHAATKPIGTPTSAASATSPVLPSTQTRESETSPTTAVVPKNPISTASNMNSSGEAAISPELDRARAPPVNPGKHTMGGRTVEHQKSKTMATAVVAGMHEDYTLY